MAERRQPAQRGLHSGRRPGVVRPRHRREPLLRESAHRPPGQRRDALHPGLRRLSGVQPLACQHPDRQVPTAPRGYRLDRRPGRRGVARAGPAQQAVASRGVPESRLPPVLRRQVAPRRHRRRSGGLRLSDQQGGLEGRIAQGRVLRPVGQPEAGVRPRRRIAAAPARQGDRTLHQRSSGPAVSRLSVVLLGAWTDPDQPGALGAVSCKGVCSRSTGATVPVRSEPARSAGGRLPGLCGHDRRHGRGSRPGARCTGSVRARREHDRLLHVRQWRRLFRRLLLRVDVAPARRQGAPVGGRDSRALPCPSSRGGGAGDHLRGAGIGHRLLSHAPGAGRSGHTGGAVDRRAHPGPAAAGPAGPGHFGTRPVLALPPLRQPGRRSLIDSQTGAMEADSLPRRPSQRAV